MALVRISVKLLGGVAVAALALTACDQVQMGAAATFSDDRITEDRLTSASRDWEKEYNKVPGSARVAMQQQMQQGGFDFNAPQRNTLDQLIRMRVTDEAARTAGISTTQSQLDDFVNKALPAGLQAPGADPQMLLGRLSISMGLPVSYNSDTARWIYQTQRLAEQVGGGIQDAQQVRLRLNAVLGKAARSMKVKVSPRYGAYDASDLLVSDVAYKLSRPESGTSSS